MHVRAQSSQRLRLIKPKPCKASTDDVEKNALCPHYDACLNLALVRNWAQFTCKFCEFRDCRAKRTLSSMELWGCYRLLYHIFVPGAGEEVS